MADKLIGSARDFLRANLIKLGWTDKNLLQICFIELKKLHKLMKGRLKTVQANLEKHKQKYISFFNFPMNFKQFNE